VGFRKYIVDWWLLIAVCKIHCFLQIAYCRLKKTGFLLKFTPDLFRGRNDKRARERELSESEN